MKVIPLAELLPAKGINFSKAQIYRKIRAGEFPRPVRLGTNRVAFVESEIDAWLASKIVQRDAPADSGVRAGRSACASKAVRTRWKRRAA